MRLAYHRSFLKEAKKPAHNIFIDDYFQHFSEFSQFKVNSAQSDVLVKARDGAIFVPFSSCNERCRAGRFSDIYAKPPACSSAHLMWKIITTASCASQFLHMPCLFASIHACIGDAANIDFKGMWGRLSLRMPAVRLLNLMGDDEIVYSHMVHVAAIATFSTSAASV